MKNAQDELVPVEWEDALVAVAQSLRSVKGSEIAAIAGGLVDAEVSDGRCLYVVRPGLKIIFVILTLGSNRTERFTKSTRRGNFVY